jgi:ankyrin repeat protein
MGVMELLLERESRLLNIPDNRGRTPLSWAAGNGTLEITKNLLQREGVDKDSRDHCGRTVLSWAVENKSQLKKISNKFGNSLSHNHILGLLLEEEGINNNSKDEDGRTPLSWAATKADLLIVKYLVSSGCISVDDPDIIGRTPLSWSAEYQRSEVVDFLLWDAGVNPNLEDQRGRTPLYWATREDNLTVMHMLIRKDIDTLKKMVKEDPEQPERVKLLLDAGYDACKLDNYGRTPLYHAVAAENVESTKLLISSGPKSINSRDNYGITPLKVAVGTSQVLAKILIENGATTNDIQPKEWFQGDKSSKEEFACLSEQGAVHGLQYMTRESLMEEVLKPLPAAHERRRLM